MKSTVLATGVLLALTLSGCAAPGHQEVANDLEHLSVLQTPDYQFMQGCEERLIPLADCELELRARQARAQKFYSLQRAQESANLSADFEAFLKEQQTTSDSSSSDQ